MDFNYSIKILTRKLFSLEDVLRRFENESIFWLKRYYRGAIVNLLRGMYGKKEKEQTEKMARATL